MYTLSGGQKSRVAFAKVTFSKPHILLLDEPSNHLDLDAVNALIQVWFLTPRAVAWQAISLLPIADYVDCFLISASLRERQELWKPMVNVRSPHESGLSPIFLEGKDCHDMHLACAGKHFDYCCHQV